MVKKMESEKLSLANMGNGKVVENFDKELDKAVQDICDPDKDPVAKRVITLKCSISPSKDGGVQHISTETTSKLAPVVAATVAMVERNEHTGLPEGREVTQLGFEE